MATVCTDDGNGMKLCRKAGETAAWDDRDVEAFLVGRGVPIGPGRLGCGTDTTGPFVRVHLPTGYDPTADVEAYVPPVNPARAALAILGPRIQAIRAMTPAVRRATPATAEDVLAIVALIRPDV